MITPSTFRSAEALDAASDEQIITAYIGDGFSRPEAEAYLSVLRGVSTSYVD